MCNFFSAFVKYLGNEEIELIRFEHLTDSHSEAADILGLLNDGNNYAKVELTPGDWNDSNTWNFMLDEDKQPHWWSEEIAFKADTLMRNALNSMRNADGNVYRVVTSQNGNKYWYRNSKFHRNDGPAIEYADGDKYWYQDGKLLISFYSRGKLIERFR